MSRHRFDALARYRAPRPAPWEPSRGFILAMTLVGMAGPILAALLGG